MTNRLRRAVLIPFAVILVTVISIYSAAMMAPDRGDVFAEQIAFMGLSVDDLCGDAHDDHHCPFCRQLTDMPDNDPVFTASMLTPTDAWQRLSSLTRDAQARNLNHSPRAPPARV